MVNGAKRLPDGWELTTVNEIADYIRGVSYKKGDASETPKNGFLPILRATNIQGDKLITNDDLVFVPEKYVKSEQFLKVGDIVVCMSSGSKHLVGKTAQLEHEWQGSFGTFCGGFRFKPNVNSKFGAYYFQSPSYREFIRKKSSGININNLRFADFESLEIPLPPLPEQERIVRRIEELFSDLEAGVAALERVRAGLRRYKASVLKAAVSGRLVNGKLGIGEGELPDGWQWVKFADLISQFRSGSTAVPKDIPSDYPILRSSSVRPRHVDYTDIRYLSQEKSENISNYLEHGDLLFTRLSGSLDYVGNCALVRTVEANKIQYPDRIFCAKLKNVEFAEFIEIWFATPIVRKKIMDLAKSTAGHKRISMGDISNQIIPLPPLEEQRRIVAEVERRLSVVGEVESAVEAGLARAARLRQAILRSAFEGRL